jgi:hypothetical protein
MYERCVPTSRAKQETRQEPELKIEMIIIKLKIFSVMLAMVSFQRQLDMAIKSSLMQQTKMPCC